MVTETPLIRPATLADVDAIVSVGHRTWPPTYTAIAGGDYVQLGLAKWWTRTEIAAQVKAGRALVAEVEEQVVAVASAGPLDGDLVLFKLYVVPEHQGRGIGQLLLERVLSEAREGGHQIIRLSYLDGNDSAREFYTRNGFTETHREHNAAGVPDSVWVVRNVWEPLP